MRRAILEFIVPWLLGVAIVVAIFASRAPASPASNSPNQHIEKEN